jgi:tetratricopeptide (TPR) repeat protein
MRQTALSLEQQGKTEESETAWRAILKSHPGDPEPYAHLGLLEARQEHYPQAIGFYRKALSLGPHLASLRMNLGLALFKNGQLKDAIDVFAPLRKSEPAGSPTAQRLTILIGMSHYGLAQYAQAAVDLKAATDRDPKNLSLLLVLAHSYLWSKQFKYVLDVYHQILTINPDSAEADMLAGEALDQMKDNTGAREMFRNAVKANPKEPNAHFGLGYLLWTQKLYPEAATEFQAELANDPNHAQSMLYLADADMQLNQTAAALPLLKRAQTLDSTLPLTYLDLGIVYSETGRNDDALHQLTKAAKLMPNDVDVHWRLARLYLATGKKEEAKLEFDNARRLNREADEALYKKIANGSARHAQATDAIPSTPANPEQ